MKVPFFLLPLKRLYLEQIVQVNGLMALLMKQRNGAAWTGEERRQLLAVLRGMAISIPLLAVFSLPGGSILLPALAWFLDRRKSRQQILQEASSGLLVEDARPLPRETGRARTVESP